MILSTRKMRIIRAPGTDAKPMIRIVNKFITDASFTIGTNIEVSYQPGVITINKIKNNEYSNLQKSSDTASASAGKI